MTVETDHRGPGGKGLALAASGLSGLKAEADTLEKMGEFSRARRAIRQCIELIDGTAEFLPNLPLLVREGDLSARLQDPESALACYGRAMALYLEYGRVDSVIATGLRIARIDHAVEPFFGYALTLLDGGYPQGGKKVLREVARRTGHQGIVDELDALRGQADEVIAAAVRRLIGDLEAGAPPEGHPRMSLEDAIAEMRRRSGLAPRPSGPVILVAPPRPPRRLPRRLAVMLGALVVLGAGGVALRPRRVVGPLPPTIVPGRIVAKAVFAVVPVAQPSATRPAITTPVRVTRADPAPVAQSPVIPRDDDRPLTGAGPLTIGPDLPEVPRTESSPAPEIASAPAVDPSVPRLPEGAVVTRPVLAVRDLAIRRIEDAGRGYRITQSLPEGGVLVLTLTPFPGDAVSAPRVVAVGADSAAGSVRLAGFMVSARAAVTPESLTHLLQRLVEVPPRD